MTQNESVTWAVRSAIEAAVLALIEQGDQRGYWKINWPEGIDPGILDEDILDLSGAISTDETTKADTSTVDRLFEPTQSQQEEAS